MADELIEADARGVKNAARRKLEHELGIAPGDVPLDSFTWLTRVHYAGASQPADGSAPLWGEHEIDWILMCTPRALPRMALNENEVAAVKEFTQAELREWMATRAARGDEVSPWFGVMEKSGILYECVATNGRHENRSRARGGCLRAAPVRLQHASHHHRHHRHHSLPPPSPLLHFL